MKTQLEVNMRFIGALFSSHPTKHSPATPRVSTQANAQTDNDLVSSAIKPGSVKAVEYALARQGGSLRMSSPEALKHIEGVRDIKARVNLYNLFAELGSPALVRLINESECAQSTLEAGHCVGPFLI